MSSPENLIQAKLLVQDGKIASLEKRLEDKTVEASKSSRALSKSIRTAAYAVFILILSNFVSKFFDIQAERSRQEFSAKADLLQGIIRETGSLEEEARKLQWQLADEESIAPPGYNKPGLLYTQSRLYGGRARDLLQRFQGMTFPHEWDDPSTTQGTAKQKAWYEVYALMACLERSSLDRSPDDVQSSQRSVKKALDYGLEKGELTKELAAEIKENSDDTPPCAAKFSPEVFGVVRARASEATWNHFERGFWSWFF